MRRLLPFARIAASGGALAAVLWRVDAGEAVSAIGDAHLAWVAAALAINLLAVLLSTLLWRTMMTGERPGLRRMCGMYLAGLFYNNIGLGTAVGDAMRLGALQRDGAAMRDAAGSVLAERLLSVLALLALASAGAIAIAGTHPQLAFGAWALSFGGCAAVAVAAIAGPRLARWRRVPESLRRALNAGAEAVASLAAQPRRIAAGGALALGVQLCTVGAALCTARAIGVPLSPFEALAIVPIIALFVSLPFSVQGIGVRETTYVTLFGIAGIAAGPALAAALLSYLATVVVSLLGGGVLAAQTLGNMSRRRHARRTPDDEPLGIAA